MTRHRYVDAQRVLLLYGWSPLLPLQTRPDHIARDNYAYSAAAGGYKGMLLHNISPKLAEWAYPIIAR